jgi:hypothetical protein
MDFRENCVPFARVKKLNVDQILKENGSISIDWLRKPGKLAMTGGQALTQGNLQTLTDTDRQTDKQTCSKIDYPIHAVLRGE